MVEKKGPVAQHDGPKRGRRGPSGWYFGAREHAAQAPRSGDKVAISDPRWADSSSNLSHGAQILTWPRRPGGGGDGHSAATKKKKRNDRKKSGMVEKKKRNDRKKAG